MIVYISTKALIEVMISIPTKGWNGEFFFFDKESNTLKQARFISVHYELLGGDVLNELTFETAEEDGSIVTRKIENRWFKNILSHFYASEEDYKNEKPCSYCPNPNYANFKRAFVPNLKNLNIYDWLKQVVPFEYNITHPYNNAVDAFRYTLDGNKIVKVFFHVPSDYEYTPESGLVPCGEIICPPNSYLTEEECRNSIKVSVCRFGQKPSAPKPKKFYFIAVNGMAKEVDEETYNKIKEIVGE